MTTDRLFIFGFGNSAQATAQRMKRDFGAICGTTRSPEKAKAIEARGVTPFLFDGAAKAIPDNGMEAALTETTHLLVSIPPDKDGDPVLRLCGDALNKARKLRWIGYLSTIGVYGNHGGAEIDETADCRPTTDRGKRRLEAERAWTAFGKEAGVPVALLRLAGIYGPGHNVLTRLKHGTARRLVKPGQVFNRIHVDDIAGLVEAIATRLRGGVFNGTDNEAAPPQDVVTYGAKLMGVEPPPEEPFETADLSPMARSFYGDTRVVTNAKARCELGWKPIYPTYREGLSALWTRGDWDAPNDSERKR